MYKHHCNGGIEYCGWRRRWGSENIIVWVERVMKRESTRRDNRKCFSAMEIPGIYESDSR